MSKKPLTESELRDLVGDRDVGPFLNPRNDQYRELRLKDNPPAKEEAIKLMAQNANLVRRPLLVSDDDIVYGWDEAEYRRRFSL